MHVSTTLATSVIVITPRRERQIAQLKLEMEEYRNTDQSWHGFKLLRKSPIVNRYGRIFASFYGRLNGLPPTPIVGIQKVQVFEAIDIPSAQRIVENEQGQ